jgi:hypothetical protein
MPPPRSVSNPSMSVFTAASAMPSLRPDNIILIVL